MPRAPLLILAVLGLGSLAPSQASLVRVQVHDETSAALLLSLDLDVIGEGPDVEIVVHRPQDLESLRAAGFVPTVVQPDLVAFYRSRLATFPASDAPPTLGQGSMGGYFTFAEMVAAMDSIQAAYPQIMAPKVSLGTSHEGRDLWMWKISDNPSVDEDEPEVLVDGLHHAREPISMEACVHLALRLCAGYGVDADLTRLVDSREIFIVPVVNPDGYVFNETTQPQGGGLWRKNRRPNTDGSFGVDLNRNYADHFGFDNFGSSPVPSSETYRGGSAFSEPCTFAMKSFAESRSLRVGLSLHAFGGMIFLPPGYATLAFPPEPLRSYYDDVNLDLQALSPGYSVGHAWSLLGVANGTTEDWWNGSLYGGQRVLGFSMEISDSTDGFWPATSRIVPLCEEAFEYERQLLKIAGADFRILGVDAADVGGQLPGTWEAGETLTITADLRNAGLSTDIATLTLATRSPWLVVDMGTVSLPPTPGFTNANSGATPLVAHILPNAPAGASIEFSVVASSPTSTDSRWRMTRRVGLRPIIAFSDTFETPSDWTVGAPGDNAPASSLWTRVSPVPTVLAGQTWNPGADHTPGAGTQCWCTGQGTPGEPAAQHDVDHVTTLVSPVFDLAHVEEPTLSYWRWYATTGHDPFTIQASNDGGTSWVDLEIVTNTRNEWTESVVRIEDFLPRTSTMRFRFRASDEPNDSTTEAAIDDFVIRGFQPLADLATPRLLTQGHVETIGLSAPWWPGATYVVGCALAAHSGIPTAGGLVPLDLDWLSSLVYDTPSIFGAFVGVLDPLGQTQATIAVPAAQSLHGFSFLVAGAVFAGTDVVATTGAVRVTVD